MSTALPPECAQGRDLGFDGKTLIHPGQIEACNAIFTPPAEEVAEARKIIAAFERPENASRGAIQLDGRMVERLHADMAKRTIAIADAIAAMGTFRSARSSFSACEKVRKRRMRGLRSAETTPHPSRCFALAATLSTRGEGRAGASRPNFPPPTHTGCREPASGCRGLSAKCESPMISGSASSAEKSDGSKNSFGSACTA